MPEVPSVEANIMMPALTPSMEQGSVGRWLVQVGEVFTQGQAIAEIETDKAVLDLEAPESGSLVRIIAAAGVDPVPVGTVIAKYVPTKRASEALRPVLSTADAAAPPVARSPPPSRPKPNQVEPRRVRTAASPLARKMAAVYGMNIQSVTGSGPGGRVVRADVERVRRNTAKTSPSVKEIPDPEVLADIPHEVHPLSQIRRQIAQRMTKSKVSIPHAYLTIEVRMDAALELRKKLNEATGPDEKHSINALLIRAMALALKEEPRANVQFCTDRLLRFSRVDLAVAVALQDGLITPIVRDAAAKSLKVISAEMRELTARARRLRLECAEYSGGTASLSNLGPWGVRQFAAIISPPQALTLAVGAIESRPVVDGTRLGVANLMVVTAAFDHRAMDGEPCAKFLGHFKRFLEVRPSLLL